MKILQKTTVFYLGFLSIILPLKFASMTMMPETTGYFPAELWEYIFVNMPGTSLGMASGIGLFLSLLSFGGSFWKDEKSYNWSLWAWLGAFLLGFTGFINASTMDYPIMAMSHIAGFLSYMLSIYFYWQSDKNSIHKILNWWSIALVMVLCVGLHQYFIGFDDQLEFYYSEMGSAANTDNLDLSAKVVERRIFSTFTGSNVLAGYLLLAGAISFYMIYLKAGRYEPAKASRIIFCVLFSAAFIFILINTGSRGAAAAVGGGVIFILFCSKVPLKYKLTGFVLILLGVAALILSSTIFGRTFGSFAERIGYWRSSFLMMGENWYAGSGWGDFFVDNMRFRILELDETARGPHNLFLIFGGSCGIFAMLAVMFASLYALVKAGIKFYKESNFFNAVMVLSLGFFIIHAMLDVNFQIGASMAIFSTLTVINSENSGKSMRHCFKILLFVLSAIIMLAALYGSYHITCGEKAYDKFKTEMHLSATEGKYTSSQVFESFKKAEKLRPYSPFHQMDMFQYCLMMNMNGLAEEHLAKALKRSPERATFYYIKAQYMYNMRNYSEALKSIEKARKLYPMSKKYREFEDFLKKNIKN